MKITVVCGMLGSGKTTFIKNFIANRPEKTVVLVNDFGQAGIDGEIFTAGGIESVELPSGCVCCTLKFDLITTMQRIVKQFSPGHLVIEPSGVASPSAVLEAIESAGIGSASVIGLVDATEFTELYQSGMYGSFFEDQIVNSDIILVNKADLAEEAAIAAAEELIGSINPLAVLLRTVNAAVTISLPEAPLQREIHAGGCHLHFETRSFLLPGITQYNELQQLFEALAGGKFGSVARAKALVNTTDGPYRFDSSFGTVHRERFEKEVAGGRIVVIGAALLAGEIERAVQGLRQP